MDHPSYRAWYAKTAREQAVWSAACALACLASPSALDSAAKAEAVVSAMRGIDVDAYVAGPETEAARLGIALTNDEFVPWYRVAVCSRIEVHRLQCQTRLNAVVRSSAMNVAGRTSTSRGRMRVG